MLVKSRMRAIVLNVLALILQFLNMWEPASSQRILIDFQSSCDWRIGLDRRKASETFR